MQPDVHLYFHIPFCKKACHYCNFHFSTSLRLKDAMVTALLTELDMQRGYLPAGELQTVYLGGGTPSQLPVKDLERIFTKITDLYGIAAGAEITLEANPDDLTPEYLADLRRHTPVNRLSIGIQSFSDTDLEWMNRAHSARHALDCLNDARAVGFDNLTIDLIYGAPTTSDEQWAENLRIAFDHDVPHLSCYCLTVEEGTALGHFVAKGKAPAVDEEKAARQFDYLLEKSSLAGYEHYETSNFARPGYYSRHNSSYWLGAPYLGIGPSAHSFDGASRQWNIANNALYIKAIEAGGIPFEREILSPEQRYNELVMTGLRTIWGLDLAQLNTLGPGFVAYFEKNAQRFVESGAMLRSGDVFTLSAEGKFLADGIAAALFWEE